MKITQRKPDTSQDESSYSTAILDNDGIIIAVGYGFTQDGADTKCLEGFIKNATL